MASQPSKIPNSIEMFDRTADGYDENTGGCTVDVARHIISISPPITSTSTILDNASGTGAISQAILRPFKLSQLSPPHVTLADGAAGMIRVAKAELARLALPVQNTDFVVAPAEDLSSLQDDVFSHSFTNMGLPLFVDGERASREIHRTVKPGGTAVVTSWRSFGYLDPVRDAQAVVLPGTEPFDLPLAKKWFDPEYIEKVMREAGFENVQMGSFEAWYAAESEEKIANFLVRLTEAVPWMKGKRDEILAELQKTVVKYAKKVKKMVYHGDKEIEVELVGLSMMAIVAVCKK
ncbi:S-adenosyl-L-methionine-dependent methyltransferase [Pseudovirgaria hyperparasitica]|uniref:S-adenosyl-L-methionine-dependent methyltransferase n=1 Tax=Pseudovirgaria hyperparasitica TaxID=470096 RepID=A0A6A6WKV1_9PEZI|nr:S-adenosyl-L-methionine-dependent methyltransferase [Pseudovirgaria hyperparasitica]KAF2762639.1 S-adenosyl-L-methionine-dependent methyltransferase [Pseudovirgaria hyperparasitica]